MSGRSDRLAERRARGRPFTPPVYKEAERPSWATYVASRTPAFKVHAKKHLAYTAVGYGGSGGRGGVIYNLVDCNGTFRWLEYERCPGPDLDRANVATQVRCGQCNGPFYRVDDNYLCEDCR